MSLDFDKLREERFAKLSTEKQAWFKNSPRAGLRELEIEKLGALNLTLAKTPAMVPGVTMTDVEIPGPNGLVPIRIFRPARAEPMGVHFNVHAGGYVMLGGLDPETCRLSNMAHDTRYIVVSPDFRLPSDHRFRTGIEDCSAALS